MTFTFSSDILGLAAEDCQGAPLVVYDATGRRIDGVVCCHRLTGEITHYMDLGNHCFTGIYPAPLKLIHVESGREITDHIQLAAIKQFTKLKRLQDAAWKRLGERIDQGFRAINPDRPSHLPTCAKITSFPVEQVRDRFSW